MFNIKNFIHLFKNDAIPSFQKVSFQTEMVRSSLADTS